MSAMISHALVSASIVLGPDWQPRRCPLMHGSGATRINGKNNGDPIMDCRQHTLAMKRTESYICDTLNTERSWTYPPASPPGRDRGMCRASKLNLFPSFYACFVALRLSG